MVDRHPQVLLRKVNIVSWESQATQQAREEFGLEAIPHLRVYGKDGTLLGTPDDPDGIEEAIRKSER